jgi:uncharacterized coiled-coil protein SlyX
MVSAKQLQDIEKKFLALEANLNEQVSSLQIRIQKPENNLASKDSIIAKLKSDLTKLDITSTKLSADLMNKTNDPLKTFASVLKKSSKESHQVINMVAADAKDRNERASNVIVVGLDKSETKNDITLLAEFFNACGASFVINSVRRLNSKTKSSGPTPNLLKVTFDSEDGKNEVLESCYRHSVDEFKGVFVREDLTPAQQTEFKEQRKTLKALNDELNETGLLDNPFRYVVHRRTKQICCINVEESSNEKRYVFASPKGKTMHKKLSND